MATNYQFSRKHRFLDLFKMTCSISSKHECGGRTLSSTIIE